jgi:hypothetical protein
MEMTVQGAPAPFSKVVPASTRALTVSSSTTLTAAASSTRLTTPSGETALRRMHIRPANMACGRRISGGGSAMARLR